jgi:hypothetical protein
MKSVPAKTRAASSVRTASDPIRRRRSDPSTSLGTVRSYRGVHEPVCVMGRSRRGDLEEHCSISTPQLQRDRRRTTGRGILGIDGPIRETNRVARIVRHLTKSQAGDRWNVIGRADLHVGGAVQRLARYGDRQVLRRWHDSSRRKERAAPGQHGRRTPAEVCEATPTTEPEELGEPASESEHVAKTGSPAGWYKDPRKPGYRLWDGHDWTEDFRDQKAGWYSDPWKHAALRWWDGSQWTGITSNKSRNLRRRLSGR